MRLRAIFALVLFVVSPAARPEDLPTFDSLWKSATNALGHRTTDGGIAVLVEAPNEHAIYSSPNLASQCIPELSSALSLRIRALSQGWSFAPEGAQV
jgi:hypothetical protein